MQTEATAAVKSSHPSIFSTSYSHLRTSSLPYPGLCVCATAPMTGTGIASLKITQ